MPILVPVEQAATRFLGFHGREPPIGSAQPHHQHSSRRQEALALIRRRGGWYRPIRRSQTRGRLVQKCTS